LRAAAQDGGIPCEGIDPPGNSSELAAGDSVTALVTLHEKGGRRTQWLIYFQATNGPIGASDDLPGAMTLYTSTGNKFDFTATPARLNVRTLGPFAEPGGKRRSTAFDDKKAGVAVNKDFLSLGFDAGAAAALRWTEASRQNGGSNFMDSFSISFEPYKGPDLSENVKLAVRLHVTTNEERSVVGWVPALGGYFNAVQQTPNLKPILMRVLKFPSLWSVIRHAGVTVSIKIDADDASRVSSDGWGLANGEPIYALPEIFAINGRPGLNLTMVVAAPRPPLLACGGIIGLLAENPAEPENYLTLRIISARRQRTKEASTGGSVSGRASGAGNGVK
jgi:hypothetical protein